MKESEYVLAGDIARVRAALSVLSDISCPSGKVQRARDLLQQMLDLAYKKLPEDWEDEP